VNKSRLRLGESLTFTLRVEGTDLLPQPVLPPLEGFRVAGTYQTVEALPGGGRALLFHYLHFLTDPNLPRPNDVEVIRPLLSLHNDVGILVEVYDG
jgi:hypothetical protein